MKKIRLKFAVSIDFLLITLVFVFFFDEHIEILINYLFPLMFLYFVVDSMLVIIPNMSKYIPSVKHFSNFYIERSNYNKEKLSKIKKSTNIRALLTFILYFGALTVIGIVYLYYDFFEEIHIYLIFLMINALDYFCILVWCPFKKIILRNSCCHTCRITNWDRLMKFYILIFVPNIFTILLVILGLIAFLIWEYQHYTHPERFYLESNKILACNGCTDSSCDKKKE